MNLADIRAVLRDPFYRYEARRYWTWRRYVWISLALVAWLGLVWAGLYFGTDEFGGSLDSGEMAVLLVMLSLFGRAPLTFEASTGAALCLVPEKVSGQLEQFILTPVDSWRFCLARLAGRLKGLGVIWLVAGTGLVFIVLVWAAKGGDNPLTLLLLTLVLQVDLAAMLVVDAAAGMRFTSTSASVPAALVKTYLTNFLVNPCGMFMGSLVGFGVAAVAMKIITSIVTFEYFWDAPLKVAVVCGFLTRLALGALAVKLALRDARNAIHRTFYQPEDRP